MVKQVSSLGRNGVHDFILIRASAIIMTLYTIYVISFCAFTDISYTTWTQFFDSGFTKIFTMVTLACIMIHAWIGIWQVLTDYVKPALLRSVVQLAVVVVLFGYFFSGLFILWGA
ncbi:succinate dehydrogenase, hydrophobic membrane anchor protein [Vibrio sp. SM6]|uniref:Succinate dehydrogenase hydrophobic membrane anchor subunit n=1 Tax=Vibrio agarilyticus TaxID=2726741 RepID=A0A7X8TN37_9VIBR|nr:succinate dehydrogenase, hydrophobic membrane anchor protein [Vibrio agarilyticus]NLS11579.1 succinate dehydrogenase, hydrophobic membrane anchor protein [Vibrio agarilyticus]